MEFTITLDGWRHHIVAAAGRMGEETSVEIPRVSTSRFYCGIISRRSKTLQGSRVVLQYRNVIAFSLLWTMGSPSSLNPARTPRLANSGNTSWTSSSSPICPCSTSCSVAMEVINLVQDAIDMVVSRVIGSFVKREHTPKDSA